ncbi:MAG TPA: carboxypeptidase-like regulatory domain-containing protein [Thermoanaerobaculia bacterium]|nr:carboxypeptidase-like regulatory domain-containing protein [Thermoanaerobaculia bacterium]
MSRALASVIIAAPLFAAQVTLTRASGCEGVLRFAIADRTIDVPAGESAFEAPEGVMVLVEPQSCWSGPVELAKEPASITLRKAHTVSGTIRNASPPGQLTFAFRPPGAEDGTLVTEIATVDAARNFAVRLPAEALDLRISAERFAPVYLWRFDAPAIPPLTLVEGASISGWVTAPRKTKLSEVTIRLTPAAAVWESPDEKRRAHTTRASETGFFQLTGIDAGTWSLVAEMDSFSPTKPLEIEIADGREEAIRRPLELRLKGSLSASITPLVDFNGKPWQIELQRRIPLSRYSRKVVTEAATAAGQWSREGLEAGQYVLNVLDGRGNTMQRAEVELASEGEHVDIRIDAVAIRGAVTMAGKPIAVTIKWYTGEGERTTIATNDDGTFDGVLPRPGRWYVDLRRGDVEYVIRKPVDVDESGEVEIVIPGGAVRGKIVDRAGRPTQALAMLEGNGTMREMAAAENGTFEIGGLETGTYSVRAQSKTARSSMISVSVSESSAAEVVLVVDAQRKVEGWLTTTEGNPIAGAQIWYWSAQSPFSPAQSGPSGQFSLTLPSAVSMIELAVVAPSRPAKLTAVPVPSKGERLHIELASARSVLRLGIASAPPYPIVYSRGAATSLSSLLRMPVGGMTPDWLDFDTGHIVLAVEPGTYEFCDSRQRRRCVTASADAGMSPLVDLRGLWETQ